VTTKYTEDRGPRLSGAELADFALLPALRRLQADGWDHHDVRGHLLGNAIDRIAQHTTGTADLHPGSYHCM
jgi:hypothetical protein